jgi:hypothetical protein
MSQPWTVVARQHARLLRPFSANGLSLALYHVNASAGSVKNAETALLVDMPRTADAWIGRLAEIQTTLATLADQCDEACAALDRLIDMAPGDEARSIEAMALVLRGLNEPAPA